MNFERVKKYLPGLIVGCAVLIAAIIRLRLLGLPLERDEGEYAYMAQLIFRGIPPYVKAYSMKFPGIYCIYAVIMTIFGQTTSGIHLGLILVNAATTIMIFFLARRLFDPYTAAFAGASFAILSLGRSVLGLSANSEHFVMLFVIAGLWLLLKALQSNNPAHFFLSGLLLGAGFITKQHSIFFIAFAVIYIAWYRARIISAGKMLYKRAITVFLSGSAAPFLCACAVFALSGSFDKFWFWTILYSKEYINKVPLALGLNFFIERLGSAALSALPVWFAAATGAGVLWRRKTPSPARAFTLSFLLFSFLAVFPGFLFRDHYFIFVLPALSILSGVAIKMVLDASFSGPASNAIRLNVSIALCLAILIFPIINERVIFFTSPPDRTSRIIYGSNPFPEAVKIAQYLKDNTDDDKSVAVLGSEPEIYFYLKRVAPTRYIYMYPLMEDQPYSFKMQDEMKREIESARPDYLVFVNLVISWTDWLILEKERTFFQWFDRYYKTYYEIIGVVNIVSDSHTEYVWGDTAKAYIPKSPHVIYVFKRRPTVTQK